MGRSSANHRRCPANNRTVGVLRLAFCVLPAWAALWSMPALCVEWPIKLAAGGYLEDANATPFPILGDAAWAIMTSMSPSEVVQYLDDRQQKGFTAVVATAMVHYPALGPANYAGQLPFKGGSSDWSMPNEEYWSQVDYVIAQAKSRGMVVFLAPAYSGYQCNDEGWCADMVAQTNAAMTTYGTWIANRYKGYGNIIWVNGGDVDCGNYANLCDRVDAVANAIRSIDPTALQTAHSGRYRSALDDYNHPWLNINSTYTDCDSYYTALPHDYERSNALPFVFIEGTYEFEGADSTCLLGQALSAYLGGALLGHFFGNTNIVNMNASWSGSSGINSPGSVLMSNVAKLLASRKWQQMVPDYNGSLVVSSRGTGSIYVAAARASDGGTAMIWLPEAKPVSVDLSQMAGTQVRAWWWNSANNSAVEIGTFAASGTKSFTPSGTRSVLVLDNAGLSLGPPGQPTPPPVAPLPPTNLTVQ